MMFIIDLSHPLTPAMPVYPGTEPPTFTATATIERDGFREKRLVLQSHVGTHVDAPAHLLHDGATLDRMPLTSFAGRALVIDCTDLERGEIDEARLQPYRSELPDHDFVLLHTGWSRHWGRPRYLEGFPVLNEAAARLLTGSGLRGIGVDALSVDPLDADDLPIHRLLLTAGLVIIENLTNLAALPQRSCLFHCFPLAIKDGDGSPVRAVALFDAPFCCPAARTAGRPG